MNDTQSGSSCSVKSSRSAKAKILIGSIGACALLGLVLGDLKAGFVIGLIVGAAFTSGG